MKHVLLFAFFISLVSCGPNQEEQMLYAYQQKKAKSNNFDLRDLDFKIHKIEKVSEITSADSAMIIKKELAELWEDNPDQSLIDTLSFDHVKNVLIESIAQQDTMVRLYQESVLLAIKSRDYSYELDSKRKRDRAIDERDSYIDNLEKIESLEGRYLAFIKNPDSVISAKYLASYSINNPMLGNVKQSFEKILYTNSEQNEFVIDMDIKE